MDEEKKELDTGEQESEAATDNGERENVVKFRKPYKFEGKEYQEIDLTGLESLTIKDAVDIQKRLFGQQEVAASVICETTTAFATAVAAKVTGYPIEFFKLMPRAAGIQVKRAVQGYLNSGRGQDGGAVLQLTKPYTFKGEVYNTVDLSGIADMNTMQESAAENEMAREGIIITENSFNYLYACIIAAMATGLPKDFFLGLPLRELLNLKDTVNNTDFFE